MGLSRYFQTHWFSVAGTWANCFQKRIATFGWTTNNSVKSIHTVVKRSLGGKSPGDELEKDLLRIAQGPIQDSIQKDAALEVSQRCIERRAHEVEYLRLLAAPIAKFVIDNWNSQSVGEEVTVFRKRFCSCMSCNSKRLVC